MKKVLLNSGIFLLSITIFLDNYKLANADAWWGYGARSSEWILSHGGTIIRYQIVNTSGEASEYKAVMFDVNGKYVEKEFGKKASFDDAKDGRYKIVAYRGGTDKRTYKGGKKFAEIMVTVHPGETIKLKFDYKKKSVEMTTDYVQPKPKPIEIAVSTEPVELKSSDSGITEFENVKAEVLTESEDSIAENVEDLIHPDVMAMESENSNVKQQEIQDEDERQNYFAKIWKSVVKLFNFLKIGY